MKRRNLLKSLFALPLLKLFGCKDEPIKPSEEVEYQIGCDTANFDDERTYYYLSSSNKYYFYEVKGNPAKYILIDYIPQSKEGTRLS